MIRYLLLPRPAELVKALFMPAAMILTRLSPSAQGHADVVGLVVFAVVFELVAYQGRYMVNDLLGAADDVRHPHAARRGRPDLTGRAERRAVAMSLLLRIFAAIATALLLAPPLRMTFAVAVLALALLAIAYETLRASKVSPVAIWVLVGTGYALRLGAGIDAAGGPLSLLGPGLAFGLAFGVMFVTMTWVLEGTALVDTGAARRKPHVSALGALVGARGSAVRALRPLAPWRAPWELAWAATAASGGLLGGSIAGSSGVRAVALGILAMAAARPLAHVGPTVAGAGILATMGIVSVLIGGGPLATIPWIVGGATYLAFRNFSYDDVLAANPLSGHRSDAPRGARPLGA